jgi:CheY-like chemotaxis protein
MQGFRVTALWNGKEALEYIEAAKEGLKPKPDIILMDVQMPLVDGYRCTHALRHHLPYKTFVRDVPIIAMTASAIQGDREKCMRAGMDDYLAKPVRNKMLEKMLVRWTLSRRQMSSPASDPTSASECSEVSEYCGGADLAFPIEMNMDEDDELGENRPNDPITPRPLTTNGSLADELSPWNPSAIGEYEPGNPAALAQLQSDGQLESSTSRTLSGAAAALTEENVGRLDRQMH